MAKDHVKMEVKRVLETLLMLNVPQAVDIFENNIFLAINLLAISTETMHLVTSTNDVKKISCNTLDCAHIIASIICC
jgi:hypothetical protein